MSEPNQSQEQIQAARNLVTVVYVLQAATFAIVFTYFIAPLLIYWKRKQAAGTWLESHLRWQLNTFWYSLAGIIAGVLTLPMLVGYMILAATVMWFVFRIGQGWTRLSRGQGISGEGLGPA